MQRIYMNNCLTTKPDPAVIEAMMPFLTEKYYLPENFIATGTQIEEDLARFRHIIAASMGAQDAEIHFTSGGTSANNLAIKGYLSANADKGTHIICSVVDYPDILTNAAFFEESGFEVTYLSADEEGFINLEELRMALRPDTVLMMTTLVNHTIGTIQPIDKIRRILDAADQHIALHVDAGQAYGKLPIDVHKDGIDMMSVSAHKIHGPKGAGALFVKNGLTLGPVKHGINRMDRLETGATSTAAIAGFAKAVEIAFDDFEAKNAYLRDLSNYLLQRIQQTIPHTLLNSPADETRRAPHNINISMDYIEGEAIMMMLDYHGITVATGSACFSEGLSPNYVLMATGRNHVQSHGSMKFTLSKYNTRQEIDFVVEKLAAIVTELRKRSPLYTQENA
jgi:cysteine desulfurase